MNGRGWNEIDLWPIGPAGIEARWRADGGTLYCFIEGSNHWADWLHHVVWGASARETIAGLRIASDLYGLGCKMSIGTYVIGGHSLGGSIASVVTLALRERGVGGVSCHVFGAKRRPRSGDGRVKIYVRKGDIVPLLPPWRKAYKQQEFFGSITWPWVAHQPKQYYDIQREKGFR